MVKRFLIVLSGTVIFITAIGNLHAATIRVPNDYKTINEAVKDALPGDTIVVDGGSYQENIVISKPITLKSENGHDGAIIKASIPTEPVFKVSNTNGVAIIGFTATASTLSGIYLHNSNDGEIRDNKTIENRNGIILHFSDNNKVANNIADFNEESGIYLESSDGNILEKNSADSNRDKGIFLSTSNYNKLIYNSASLNTWNGITLWSSNNNLLQKNKILRNTYGIVLSNSEENILQDNTVWSNIYIILPVILIYAGIILYLIQQRIFRYIYSE